MANLDWWNNKESLGPVADIQARMSAIHGQLSPALQRVAETIMADPAVSVNLTMAEIASRAGTSEPTVLRLCRLLDFKGYPQLRLALASEVGRNKARFEDLDISAPAISPADSVAEILSKIQYNELTAIEQTLSNQDPAYIAELVSILFEAPKIHLYGMGAAGLTARDLEYKFFRIGRDAVCYPNHHDALIGAALMRPHEAAFAISHSGSSGEVLDFINAAKNAGNPTAAICNSADSEVARAVDYAAIAYVADGPVRSGASASRLAHLALADAIFTAVATSDYPRTKAAMDRSREVVPARQRRDFSL